MAPLPPQVTDCEARDGGFFAQEVNAWTSFAYLAAGVWICVLGHRKGSPAFVAFGAVVVLEGVGSILLHGTDAVFGQLVHDVGLVALLWAIAGWHLARAARRLPASSEPGPDEGTRSVAVGAVATTTATRGSRASSAPAGLTIGLLVGAAMGVLAWAGPDLVMHAATATAVAVVLACEWSARRNGQPATWTPRLAALLAAGGAMWLVGTPDSPLCDEQSLLQPHAAWHVLSALALVEWARRALSAPSSST